MYKNRLNGYISDNNSLKKQKDYGSIIKKYNKKLPTKPNELQKYYQYMTYQQPILDELNYVAERMRTEDIVKEKDDYNFVDNLKIEREKTMKEESIKENDIINDIFDYSSTVKQEDMTPTINTDVELEYEIRDRTDYNNNNREQVFIYEDLGFDANNNINELSYNEALLLEDKNKLSYNKPLLLEDKNKLSYNEPLLLKDKKLSKSQKKAKKKYEEALNKYSISTDISDTMNRPIEKTLSAPSKNELSNLLFENISKNMPISEDLQKKDKKSKSTIASQAETEKYSNIPKNKRKGGGRPKGSKNIPKRTLDLTK